MRFKVHVGAASLAALLVGTPALADVTAASDEQENSIATGASTTGAIADNDTAVFTINDQTVDEAAGMLTFTLSLSNPVDVPVTVDVLRNQGFLDGFGIDLADPNVIGDETDPRIVGSDVTQGNEEGGRRAMENLLAVDPTIEREIRPRTIEEVSRYLTYPFSLIWIGAAISFLILLWRGLIRFGPPKRTDEGHIAASKTASIAAKGYLMRLAGDDRSLLRAFVAEKMQALARDTMGKQAQMDPAKLTQRLGAIAPRNAAQLQTVLADVDRLGHDTSPADLARLADRFEQTYRSIRDELGHVSRGR